MPLTGDPKKDIPELMHTGRPQKQAVAIALKEQRGDADSKTFEVQIWEKAEHWTFDTTIEAASEEDARAKLRREYPPKDYTVKDLRMRHDDDGKPHDELRDTEQEMRDDASLLSVAGARSLGKGFARKGWTKEQAKKWLRDNDYSEGNDEHVMEGMRDYGYEQKGRDDAIHPDYSKAKNDPKVQKAAAHYREVYSKGGAELKEAEAELNKAVEAFIGPKGSRSDSDFWSAMNARLADVAESINELGQRAARLDADRQYGIKVISKSQLENMLNNGWEQQWDTSRDGRVELRNLNGRVEQFYIRDYRSDDMTDRDWDGVEKFIEEEKQEGEHREDAKRGDDEHREDASLAQWNEVYDRELNKGKSPEEAAKIAHKEAPQGRKSPRDRGDASITERVSDPAGKSRAYAHQGRSIEELAKAFKNDREGWEIAERAYRATSKTNQGDAEGKFRKGQKVKITGGTFAGKSGVVHNIANIGKQGNWYWVSIPDAHQTPDIEESDLRADSRGDATDPATQINNLKLTIRYLESQPDYSPARVADLKKELKELESRKDAFGDRNNKIDPELRRNFQRASAAAERARESYREGKITKEQRDQAVKKSEDIGREFMKASRGDDIKDLWEEGYRAGKRNDKRNPYMNDSGKAREWYAGWYAAQKDMGRIDADPDESVLKDVLRMDAAGPLSAAQINQLKREYGKVKDARISDELSDRMLNLMDRAPKAVLVQLAAEDIPWISALARNRTRSDAVPARPLKGHPYHSKSEAELRYIMKDAKEAAKAMQGHDPAAEGKYLDQMNDAATVLHWRTLGGRQDADIKAALDSASETIHLLGKSVAKIGEDLADIEKQQSEKEEEKTAKDAVGRKYYTLLVDGAIHFGDYDREVVKQEMEDECDSRGISKSRCKIVVSGDTQAEINAAIK